jgi:hypothetical protein
MCQNFCQNFKTDNFQRRFGYIIGFAVMAAMIILDITERRALDEDDFEKAEMHNYYHSVLRDVFWGLWLFSFF